MMSNDLPIAVRARSWLLNARFLSVSLAIHLILGIFLGGLVLFRAVQESQSFQVSSTDFLAPEEQSNEIVEETLPEFSEPKEDGAIEAAEISMQASAVAALTDSASLFHVSNFSPVQTMGNTFGGTKFGALNGTSSSGGIGGSRSIGVSKSFFGVPAVQGTRGLTGVFYDLKQDMKRQPTGMSPSKHGQVVLDFVDGWKESKLKPYFKAPESLVATQIFIPNMSANNGPKAFGVEKDVKPAMWLALYKGSVSPPRNGTYYFVGGGDDILFVRFNNKIVLDGSWSRRAGIKPEAIYDYGFSGVQDGFAKGTAVRVQKGRYYDIEILIGEQPGGLFFATLLIEEEGAEYKKDAGGNPILPVFRVENSEVPPLGPGQSYPPFAADGPVWLAR